MSGLHAQLECLGSEWTIIDDGLSTNGTFVNGERVSGRTRLHDGDRVRVGRTVLVFNAAQASAPGTTVVAGELPAAPPLTDSQRRVLIALCRPYRDGGSFATPASNQQIASEVFLSVDTVKTHLRTLFNRFGLGELPQNQKRARLAECAIQSGLVTQRDLGSVQRAVAIAHKASRANATSNSEVGASQPRGGLRSAVSFRLGHRARRRSRRDAAVGSGKPQRS